MRQSVRQPKFWRYSTVGLEFVLTFILCLGLGYWLDRRFQTIPGFMLLGAGTGFAAGLYRLVRQGKELSRIGDKSRREDDSSGQSSPPGDGCGKTDSNDS